MGNLTISHWIFIFVNVLIVAYMYILVGIKYKDLPDEIPSHYNFKGECDSYSGKGIVFLLPAISTFILFLFTLLCFIPKEYWKINLGVESIELPEDVRTNVVHISCYYFIISTFVICAYLAYLETRMIYIKNLSMISIIVFIIALVLLTFVYIYFLYMKIRRFIP